MNPVKRLAGYLDTGIWEIRLHDHRGFHAVLIRYMRTLVLAYRNFKRNDSIRTTSVLTYYSVLNFVPLVAVVFAIAKGFGLRRVIERMGDELPPARSDSDKMIRQLSEALKGTGDLRIRDL